jgi:hypothetical protein
VRGIDCFFNWVSCYNSIYEVQSNGNRIVFNNILRAVVFNIVAKKKEGDVNKTEKKDVAKQFKVIRKDRAINKNCGTC